LKKNLIILFLSTVLLGSQAAPYLTRSNAYRYFSTRDGLAQMQVLCAFQDRDGYMWFGTKGGVSRFDGVTFKSYLPEDGFPSGQVNSIAEWGLIKVVTTSQGIVLIHPNDSMSVHLYPDKILSRGTRCNNLPLDNNRLLVFNHYQQGKNPESKDGVIHYVFQLKQNRFVPLKGFKELVIEIKHDTILTHIGLFKQVGLNLKRILKFPNEIVNGGKRYGVMVDWKRNIFYFEYYNVFLKYQLRNGKFSFVGKVITKEGVGCRSVASDSALLSTYCLNNPSFYPKSGIQIGSHITYPNFFFIDREKNLWICTDNGLYNYFSLNIEEYRFNLGDPDNIWSIVEDNKQNMWFGSYGNGLWVLHPDGKLTATQRYRTWDLQYMGSTKTPNGDMYMTHARGVARFVNGELKYVSNTSACLSIIYDDKSRQMIYSGMDTISNTRGLYVGMGKNKKFYSWEKGFPLCFARDANGRIRLGGGRGQAVFTGDSIITDVTVNEYKAVVCMSVDNKGRLWKGTERGVYVELPNGKEFRVGGIRLNGQINSMLVYHNKYLLVGGARSLMVVDIRNIKSYADPTMWEIGYDAGFTGLESGQNGFCEDHNGDVWLCTALNVLKFNPEKLVEAQSQLMPLLRISDIAFSTDNINWKQHYFYNGKVQLKADNKFIRVEYVANSISAPKSLRFKYRLVGFSDKWSEPGYTKSVSYTNIGFGTYRFEVQCSMDGVRWSKIVSSPEIEVITPLWARWYILLSYVTIFVLIIVLLTRRVIQSKQEKKMDVISRQKLENELQLKTLRSKVIPHFTKNVLSAIGYFAMTDKLKAGHYISLFSDFTQSTLANADKNYISLNEELKYIQNYLELEKMRFGDKFDFQIQVSEKISMDLLIPSMILHTYCDNAIRHGLVQKDGLGLIKIEITASDKGVLIAVTDNGIGRKTATLRGTRGNGQGLKLVQAQVDFYNQINKQFITQQIIDLEDLQLNTVGTRVELFIPGGYRFKD